MKEPLNISRLSFGCLSGMLLTASFPSLGIGVLAWIAMIPLLIALNNLTSFDGFRLGFLAGIVHYLTLLYWFIPFLTTYGPFPVVVSLGILLLLSSYLSLFWGIFGLIIARLRLSLAMLVLIAPAIWVSLEFIRSHLFTGFPWELLGHSQFSALHLIQISDIVGVYGISFILMMANSLLLCLFYYMTGRKWQNQALVLKAVMAVAIISLVIIGAVWGYGTWKIPRVKTDIARAEQKKIAIVQGNIDQTEKWDTAYQISTINKYLALSGSAENGQTDLIIWPETSMPFYFSNNIPLTTMVRKGIDANGMDTLLGSPYYTHDRGRVEYFNRAFLVASNGEIQDHYDKAHLVPFGEYVPLKRWLPFLGKMVAQVGDFSAGTVGDTLEWGQNKIGVLICYELIFPVLSRFTTRHGADLLINTTNDAWYGRTSAPYQHFSMAVFRAIETRRTLVRAANTGISGVVDPSGEIVAKTDIFEDAVITETIPLMNGQTLYVQYGDFFAVFCVVSSLVVIIFTNLNNLYTTRISKRRN